MGRPSKRTIETGARVRARKTFTEMVDAFRDLPDEARDKVLSAMRVHATACLEIDDGWARALHDVAQALDTGHRIPEVELPDVDDPVAQDAEYVLRAVFTALVEMPESDQRGRLAQTVAEIAQSLGISRERIDVDDTYFRLRLSHQRLRAS